MLIADDAGSLAGLQINKAHVQGNLVFFVQVIPYHIGKGVQIAFACDGPYLIDCAIDKDEFVLPMLPPGGSMDDIITRIGD